MFMPCMAWTDNHGMAMSFDAFVLQERWSFVPVSFGSAAPDLPMNAQHLRLI